MALTPGTRLGPYEIAAQIGAGGMGEVYRARDAKLGRDVAIKVLPEIFTRDPERLARFEREARLLAALNHPNIGAIYGLEETEPSPGFRQRVQGLVLELVEGPTLGDRLATGPLPFAEALTLAQQITDALDAAHEKGIVHRDLKPANIKITPDGLVKVLDFGLAKAAATDGSSPGLSHSPTVTMDRTRDGVLLGTAAYMSPEQARGQAVDKRTDVWAFGCVLFEMLTARAAFPGATVSDTIVAILDREPDWSALPPTTSASVRHLLARCLTKDSRRRLRDIGDARSELEQQPLEPAPAPLPIRRRWWPIAASLAAGLAIATGAWFAVAARRGVRLEPALRFEIGPPPGAQFFRVPNRGGIALSSDGLMLAFTALRDRQLRLWILPLQSSVARELPATEGAHLPFWSPDNRSLAFFAGNQLKRIDVDGGRLQVLADAVSPQGGTWSGNDTILYAPDYFGLFRIPASGGRPMAVTMLDRGRGEGTQVSPRFLADGTRFLYVITGATPEVAGVYVGSVDDSALKVRLMPLESWPVPTQNAANGKGYIVWVRGTTVVAQRWNPVTLQLLGDPVPLGGPVGLFGSTPELTVSQNGLLVYGPPNHLDLAWVDRTGASVGHLGESAALVITPEFSPDGRLVASGMTGALVIRDLSRGLAMQLAPSASSDNLIWSPDSTRIAFTIAKDGVANVVVRTIDDAGSGVVAAPSPARQTPVAWLRNESSLVYGERESPDQWRLWMTSPAGKPVVSRSTPIRASSGLHAKVSADGQWLAYASDETGTSEIHVEPFGAAQQGGHQRLQASSRGGSFPRWRRDDQELFYVSAAGQLMSVPVRHGTIGLELGAPRGLFSLPTVYNAGYSYDVAPDGERFLVVAPSTESSRAPLSVIVNWPTALDRQP